MFTFSFSTAFAAVATTEDANLVKAAGAYAQSKTAETIENAYTAVLGATTNNVDYITAAAWAAAAADIVKAINEDIQNDVNAYLADGSLLDAKDGWKAYPNDMNYTADKLFNDYRTYTEWAAILNSTANEYAIAAAGEQFKADYAEAVALYDKIDLDALYSKTTPVGADDSYYDLAKAAVKASKEALKAVYFDEDGEILDRFDTYAELEYEAEAVERIIATGSVANVAAVASVLWEGTEVVKYYYLADTETFVTKDAEAADDAVIAATTASLKAIIATNIANYAKLPTYDKTFAANYAEVFNYLAEKLPTNAQLATDLGYHTTHMDQAAASFATTFKTVIGEVADLEAAAARYAAEKDAEGVLVRDAEAVAKLVAKAKLNEYQAVAGIAANEYSVETAESAIAAMNLDRSAEELAFDKEAKKYDLNTTMKADLKNNYYDLEDAAVEAAYAAAIAAVDAAKDTDEFEEIDDALEEALDDILTKTEVEALFVNKVAMATELEKQASALEAYVTYVNAPIAGKTYEDAYVKMEANKADDLLKAYYIANNARTADDMKALTGAVEAVAAKLPTTAEITAAEKAAVAAEKAIPAKVTSAAKDLVIAADNAIDALDTLLTNGGFAKSTLSVADQAEALENALTADYLLAYAKTTKTDKAALKALKAEIAALNTELDAIGDTDVTVVVAGIQTDLDKIQAAEKAAVEKAINAIPINVTEADKATVEAARAAYEAYVAEYTDYSDNRVPNDEDGFVADDINITDLLTAEAILGLNVDTDAKIIASVESLKIKASSTKGKGWIKVQWKVTGDTTNVEGYQLYKSTKAQKNYKKCITTTKTSFKNTKNIEAGTRYYYKVRAFVTVDGVKYYSDWSNKANRVAK